MSESPRFTADDVCVAVMNYNGADKLPALFESIFALTTPPGEIMIVDDGSTDGGGEKIAETHANVGFFSLGRNTGILNKVRNRAFRESTRELVFIVDNDVILRPDCVDELVDVFNQSPDIAACMTRAVYFDRPDVIYQDGQILHYVGSSPGTNRESRVDEVSDEPRISIGWGVQMIRKSMAGEVGYFNENYLLGWGDDGEINHKLNLRGYRCLQVPRAVVLHKRDQSSRRYLAAVRNRLRFIGEMYQIRTIVLALPAFALYECALFAFLAMKGGLKDWFRGWGYFLTHLGSVARARRPIQQTRKLKDSEVMGAGDIFVYSDYVDNRILRGGYGLLNRFLNAYWVVIRRFV